MSSEREIGRVIAVDTAQLTIELNYELKALTRATGQGVEEVARINSYVILPVGALRIVAMVTRVFLTEEAELGQGKAFVTLPSARRLMRATMVGTIAGRKFGQGISSFPVLDNPVLVASKDDMDIIFGCGQTGTCSGAPESAESSDPTKPGHCVSIGTSAIFDGYPIQIDPDAFFGKHAAIIGSTGSGKSCTIAAILQSILQHKDVKQTRFVILDTNGEYHAAFTDKTCRCLYIPSDPSQSQERLVIPYWLMNSDDFARLFRASSAVQRPVLQEAISVARAGEGPLASVPVLRGELICEANRVLALARGIDRADARGIRQLCDQVVKFLDDNRETLDQLSATCSDLTSDAVVEAFNKTKDVVRTGIVREGEVYERYEAVGMEKRHQIENLLSPLVGKLVSRSTQAPPAGGSPTVDSPRYFSKLKFLQADLDRAMTSHETSAARLRENCSTMLMRINRLLDDQRYDFVFGRSGADWPEPLHSLAAFLRDVLGMTSATDGLSGKEVVGDGLLPFYDRQRNGVEENHNVVVVDLSLLAAEVLENVTALMGRLILEFLQRAGDAELSGIKRGEFPVVLVLEEAQNYIRQPRRQDDESISRDVYERIAREGRKYGLSLVVASQRPSELSKTVLSQCSTFIVHRLQNPEDLRYFKEIVPGVYEELLEQLPALAAQYALVLGEGVRAPSLMRVRDANPIPLSKDPRFWAAWTADEPKLPNVEKVCADWEGRPRSDSGQGEHEGTQTGQEAHN